MKNQGEKPDPQTSWLLKPIKLGPYELPNRFVMAALTRCRSDPKTSIPSDLHVQYYSERAENSGFVLTECTSISKEGSCFQGACGIYNDEQVEGWKRVTEAVHKKNGRIFLQIWHAGRAARSKYYGIKPVGPTNLPIRYPNKEGGIFPEEAPEELTEENILRIVEDFRQGAERALKADFDGLELHGANGYLIDEFLRDAVNTRTDKYGGSPENRCRFPLMVIDALASVYGYDRVGIKVSPVGRYQDMFDSDPYATYSYFLEQLSKRNFAFVEVARAPEFAQVPNLYGIAGEDQMPNIWRDLKKHFNGVFIGNNGITPEEAEKLGNEGVIDMVSFGRLFIANPDLVERYKNGWGYNAPDFTTFYTPGPKGYIDYPKYSV